MLEEMDTKNDGWDAVVVGIRDLCARDTLGTMLVQLRSSTEAVHTVELADREAQEATQDGVDLAEILASFKWEASGDASQLETSLQNELIALENTNMKAIIEGEERAGFILRQLDSALISLQRIDEWMLFYTSLLEQMGHDVHDIEAYHKNMETISRNQKRLQAELELVVDTLKMSQADIHSLRERPLQTVEDLTHCEAATDNLLRLGKLKVGGIYDEMQAVKERLALLTGYGNNFSQRLLTFLTDHFQDVGDMQIAASKRSSKRGRPQLLSLDVVESELYKYVKLLFFLQHSDVRKHTELQMSYSHALNRVYGKIFHDFIEQLKPLIIRKVGDKAYIFAPTQATIVLLASNALKSAKKASTVDLSAKDKLLAFRKKKTMVEGDDDGDSSTGASAGFGMSTVFGQSRANLDVNNQNNIKEDDKISIYEACMYAINASIPVLVHEQNIFIDLFSLVEPSAENRNSFQNLPESNTRPILTANAAPELVEEWRKQLSTVRTVELPTRITGKVQNAMSEIFSSVRDELCVFVESSLRTDATFCVPVLYFIEGTIESYRKTNYSYLVNLLEYLYTRCSLLYEKFVDTQIVAIEDLKSVTKKKPGVLPMVQSYVAFVERIQQFKVDERPLTSALVWKSLNGLLNSIFDTLTAISQTYRDGGKLDGDRDSLSAHSCYIENMAYLVEKFASLNIPEFDTYAKKSRQSYESHLASYCTVCSNRIFDKLSEFFSGVDQLLITTAPNEIGYHIQYNKVALKNVVKRTPALDVKKSIELAYRKIERHFEPEVGKEVWANLQETIVNQLVHYEELIYLCYPDAAISLEFGKVELAGMFNSI